MNQYPPDNPPPYDYAISDQSQSTGKSSNTLCQLYDSYFFSVTISESISTQAAGNKTYPILPSAPLQEQAYQNYGSISENIQSQPAVNHIVILPANACPICRIGESDSSGTFVLWRNHFVIL